MYVRNSDVYKQGTFEIMEGKKRTEKRLHAGRLCEESSMYVLQVCAYFLNFHTH